jgi:hypothetical protein
MARGEQEVRASYWCQYSQRVVLRFSVHRQLVPHGLVQVDPQVMGQVSQQDGYIRSLGGHCGRLSRVHSLVAKLAPLELLQQFPRLHGDAEGQIARGVKGLSLASGAERQERLKGGIANQGAAPARSSGRCASAAARDPDGRRRDPGASAEAGHEAYYTPCR